MAEHNMNDSNARQWQRRTLLRYSWHCASHLELDTIGHDSAGARGDQRTGEAALRAVLPRLCPLTLVRLRSRTACAVCTQSGKGPGNRRRHRHDRRVPLRRATVAALTCRRATTPTA